MTAWRLRSLERVVDTWTTFNGLLGSFFLKALGHYSTYLWAPGIARLGALKSGSLCLGLAVIRWVSAAGGLLRIQEASLRARSLEFELG